MKKPLSLEGFVKVDANRDHTVFAHKEDGHLIYISNKKISKEYHDQLRALPIQKMSKGGMVQRPTPSPYDRAAQTIGNTGTPQAQANVMKAFKRMSGESGDFRDQIVPEPKEKDLAALKALFESPAEQFSTPAVAPGAPLMEQRGGSVGNRIQDALAGEPEGLEKRLPSQAALLDKLKTDVTVPRGGIGAYPNPLSALSSAGSFLQDVITPNRGLKPGEAPQVALTKDAPAAGPTNFPLTAPEQPTERGLSTPAAPMANPLQDAADLYAQGARAEAKAAGEVGKEQQGILDKYISQQNDLNTRVNDNLLAMERASKEWQAKLLSKEVNPDRFMQSKSTLGKILTGVGLMIGGAPAAAFVEKQIEQDIKAQQADLDNQNTLYAQNMKMFGNVQDALTATRLQMNGMVEAQLKAATLKQSSPQAIAAGQMKVAEYQAKHADEMLKFSQSLAQRQMQQQMMGKSGSNMTVEDAEAAIRAGLVPKEQQAEAMKEVEYLKGLKVAQASAKDAYRTALGVGTTGALIGKVKPGGTQSQRDLDLLNAKLEGILRENRPPGSGVLTDADAKAIIAPYLVNATDSAKAIADKARAFEQKLSGMYSKSGTLGTYGIKIAPPKTGGGPTPQGL
jgi:hypothetical protein